MSPYDDATPWGFNGPYIYGHPNGGNRRHLGEGPIVRVRLSIDKITSPSFRFYVRDLRDWGLRIAATLRMTRQEARELEVGASMYVILWDQGMEVQIEILAAEDPRGDHSERARGSASRPAVFLDHVRELLGPGVSARSSRAGRPSSGFRPAELFGGPPPGSGLFNELLNQAQTEEESYNTLVDNALDESFVAGAGRGPQRSGGHLRPS